jgi:hypothetical protein
MLAIRKVRLIPLLAALVVLAIFVAVIASSGRQHFIRKNAEALNTYDVGEPPPSEHAPPPAAVMATMRVADAPPPPQETMAGSEPADSGEAAAAMTPIQVSIPKLAYAYSLGFRLPGEKIAAAQEAHRSACENMGPARCQLLGMARGSADDEQTEARLKLRVASSEARKFSDEAVRVVAKAGGRAIKTNVTAEDVSKEIVDAEARIHQRELLVARLTEILRTRSGKVAELVEAERSVAQAQEELDQTKGWLTELRGRVAMSDLDISYVAIARATTPESRDMQLGEVVLDSGSNFAIGLKGILMVLIYLLPWLLLALPVMWFAWRRTRRAGGEPAPAEPVAEV